MFAIISRLSQNKRVRFGVVSGLFCGNLLQSVLSDYGLNRAALVVAATEAVVLAAIVIFYVERSRRCLD